MLKVVQGGCCLSAQFELNNPGPFWSHVRLSKGHQEIQMIYFGSLCDDDYLTLTMECVTHLQTSMVMGFW